MIDSTRKKKILLAEDDSSMRRFVEIILQQAGYEVLTAEDGLQAMQAALAGDIDAVVTDAVMPHLTGHDLCRFLKQNPDFRHVPIIMLSGLEKEIAPNAEDACAEVYLVKGVNLKNELIENLENLLENSV